MIPLVYETGPVSNDRQEPVLVCDEAAETLAMRSKTLAFVRKGSREQLDRQIDTMRRGLAEMKSSR